MIVIMLKMYYLYVYVSGITVSHMCIGAYREQRMGRILLQLELQVAVSYSAPLASTVNC